MMISLFQLSPLLSKSIVPIFLNNFKNNIGLYKDMIEKTKYLNSFVRNLYRCEPEILKYFFALLTNLYNNFQYPPSIELTNLISSISLFSEVANIKALVNGLKDFNNLVNQKKKSYLLLKKINQNTSKKQNLKKSSILEIQDQEELDSINFFEEINQNYINKIMDIINDILSKIKQNQTKNLFKPELLYFLFDYIQEIIKKE